MITHFSQQKPQQDFVIASPKGVAISKQAFLRLLRSLLFLAMTASLDKYIISKNYLLPFSVGRLAPNMLAISSIDSRRFFISFSEAFPESLRRPNQNFVSLADFKAMVKKFVKSLSSWQLELLSHLLRCSLLLELTG